MPSAAVISVAFNSARSTGTPPARRLGCQLQIDRVSSPFDGVSKAGRLLDAVPRRCDSLANCRRAAILRTHFRGPFIGLDCDEVIARFQSLLAPSLHCVGAIAIDLCIRCRTSGNWVKRNRANRQFLPVERNRAGHRGLIGATAATERNRQKSRCNDCNVSPAIL